ncbi:MAG: type I-MYXAN CRISPR-associated protein Cas6/Cmx6 [Sideroxydans sp.]|jgi:CRISPR-associated protein Cas6
MTEVSIDISGVTLPVAYPFALWDALVQHVPGLQESPDVSIVPFRLSACEGNLLLAKRTKLAIRLPEDMATAVAVLSGKVLEIDGHRVELGSSHLRALQPHPTLHAPLVTGCEDEIMFMQEIRARLDAMGIGANLICGRRSSLKNDEREIIGYSLVVHDLKPEESLRLQGNGLGTDRCYGCGVFLPYKAISIFE